MYLIVVPKTATTGQFNYLFPAQKELINTGIQATKLTTTETTFIDPIYKAVSLGIASGEFSPTTDEDLCELVIVKTTTSRRDNQALINDVVNVFTNYFNRGEIKLNQTLNVRELTQQILAILQDLHL